ncbi:MAG: class I SAM-dependent methyltransferase, partial [Alphaproteobacteria bacterium]|nr:class I SAM-dependent methyltransferase [Alphaproteobacteria bacterium]
MFSKLLHSWNSLPISQARNRRLPVMLSQHIPTGSTVLDVGSGNGEMAWKLGNIGAFKSIVGVDVVLQPDPRISVSRFDGVSLPFADKEFDVVTLIDVLHHCEAQAALVADALRVARSHVVIKDHYWITEIDRLILKISDYIGNRPYG